MTSNPNAPSNRSLNIAAVYEKNEKEKKGAYNNKVLQIEKVSFVLLVYTSGGMSPQCVKSHKTIAQISGVTTGPADPASWEVAPLGAAL